jgi:hypothetical protein
MLSHPWLLVLAFAWAALLVGAVWWHHNLKQRDREEERSVKERSIDDESTRPGL